jgi:hypothetical protein
VHISPDVVFRILGDGAVLVHLPSNEVYELNATGSRVWALFEQGLDLEGIVASVVAEFDIDPATARHECARLLTDLQSRGLLLP